MKKTQVYKRDGENTKNLMSIGMDHEIYKIRKNN